VAEDPYRVLGVERTASREDIQKAYRALAKKLHPDLHPGDAKAEDRFKAVSAAYGLLNDPDKRARYDRGEIDASGGERPQRTYYRQFADSGPDHPYHAQGAFADLGDIGDVFADLFGNARGGTRARGGDVRYRLDVDFLDAVNGTTRRVTMPDGRTLDVAIPPGMRDGQVLRLKGQGAPGPRGSGDALVEVHVAPHPDFERRGDDIHVTVAISLPEAVLGARIPVHTTDGTVTVTVPKKADGGTTLRLRGKGVPTGRDGKRGDQYVHLRIAMPETIDPELKAFMRDWGKNHGYDPRRRERK
jgi:DnaJ-class molecular chaperone